MTEEMWLLMLRKAKENFVEGRDACPFCRLATLRKVRDMGFSAYSSYDICGYCYFEYPNCIISGKTKLLALEVKFNKSDWAYEKGNVTTSIEKSIGRLLWKNFFVPCAGS